MTELNLVYPERSHIKFEHRKYPEGQQDILINSVGAFAPVQIITRFNNWQDLEMIVCATKALRNMGVKEIHLYCPYMLGARSDRKFQDGGTSYLRDVVAPVINSLNFESVTVMDPHSDGVENTINNIVKLTNLTLVQDAIKIISKDYVLISPDAGAQKKIYYVAEKLGAKNVITASKHREISTGKILSTEVHVPDELKKLDTYIVDDICDGGRTFIELAKALRDNSVSGRIILVVTHGIFSAGFEELSKYFDRIFTTNSVKDIDNEFISQLNIF